MEKDKLPSLPERREIIHDLIKKLHKTGLSPPEETILLGLESQELKSPEHHSAPVLLCKGDDIMDNYEFDPLEKLDQACLEYRCATIRIAGSQNKESKKSFHEAAVNYKRSIDEAIKFLKSEQKEIERTKQIFG